MNEADIKFILDETNQTDNNIESCLFHLVNGHDILIDCKNGDMMDIDETIKSIYAFVDTKTIMIPYDVVLYAEITYIDEHHRTIKW